MKACDFIRESRPSSIQNDVARALPATYTIPKLPNQDPYKQYRFGVAIAAAKGQSARAKEGEPPFAATTPWGENEIVVSYDSNIAEWLDAALELVGLSPSDKVLISTRTSEEAPDVDKTSPVKPFKGYQRK
jgi:hypothetical protein